ncbi:MAG: LCP family protein [Actinomycetia bacterium]|nr:LCP family protein [Actinomycetes bacterium]
MSFLKNKIAAIIIIMLIPALLSFAVYKLFFDKDKILGQETFFLAVIDKEDGIEEVKHLFLADISETDNSIQLIMIPTSLQCDLPGLSKMELGQIYPFGGNSIVLEAFSDTLGLDPGYYFTVDTGYLNDLIKKISPITLDFKEDINFNEHSFENGENILEEEELLSLIEYSYDKNHEKDFLNNKLYIFSRVLDAARKTKIDLLDMSSSHLRDTNLKTRFINKINTIFTDSSSKVYLYMVDREPDNRDIGELKNIIIAGEYREMGPEGLVRFYPMIIEREPEEELPEETEEAEEIVEIKRDELIIQTLNGNYIPGTATVTAGKVEELGYKVFGIGNVEEGTIYDNTFIYYKEGLEEFAAEIGSYLNIGEDYIQVFEDGAEDGIDIIIIVGLDFGEEQ